MQTFLPFPSYEESARALDNRRLFKQQIEVLQLLAAITCSGKGWVNHPCARMWQRNAFSLAHYGHAMVREWKRRGYLDKASVASKIGDVMTLSAWRHEQVHTPPAWLGREDFHSAHRVALLCKSEWKFMMTGDDRDFVWYSSQGWSERPTADCTYTYVWPE